jgi:hypothetical protein
MVKPAKLWEVASLVRSKNAGPFVQTIDILFNDDASLRRVLGRGVLTPELIATTYGIDAAEVRVIVHEAARAIKIAWPRPVVAGSLGDDDVFGAQVFAAIVELEV